MKPIEVEFQAFGPYAGKENVNFEKLSSKGLFLICGNTGSGKTTILDAMTFALYGKSSTGARDDFESMRCTKADFETATYVKFCFENNGERYIFERRLDRKKKNLSSSYNAAVLNSEGIYTPLFENAKEKSLNEAAARIIGLEYEQFRQVIVLPQGQFEKFLTSGSDEKERILTSIFGEEKWRIIAEKFYEEATARKEEYREVKNRIQLSLQEENCESTADLSLLIETKKNELDELVQAFNANQFDKKKEKLQKELILSKRFEDLDRAFNKCTELENLRPKQEDVQKRINAALTASKVKTFIDEKDVAKSNFDKRSEELNERKKESGNAKKAYEDCEEQLKELCKRDDEIAEKSVLFIQLQSKRSVYEQIEKVRESYNDLTAKEKECMAKEKSIAENFAQIVADVENAKNLYDEYNNEHTDLMNRYIAGIGGELAADLAEGKPCPVCGSTVHPHKAQKTSDSVSKQDVDEAKCKLDEAYDSWNNLAKSQDASKKQLDDIREELKNKQSDAMLQKSKLEEMQNTLVEGIDSLKALEDKINSLDKLIDDYKKDKDELSEKRDALLTECTRTQTRELAAVKEKEDSLCKLNEADKTLAEVLIRNDFSSEDKAREFLIDEEQLESMQKEIQEYYANLKAGKENYEELKSELAESDRPDKGEAEQKQKQIEKAEAEYLQESAILREEISRLSEKYGQLSKTGSGLEEKIRQAEEDWTFAKKLRGDSGTGLQRYVLGVMFSSVVNSANKMLELVHDGRYRLYRSDDKNVGNKRGLELKVFDKNSEEHEGRFVNTLSGGEKFLTSLALSIGMSNVASKSGIKIEALFIDEGFGSLDEDSISDAMDILNSIQKANGTVGIISHVGLLQDRIGTKLKIEEDKSGSHIVETIG